MIRIALQTLSPLSRAGLVQMLSAESDLHITGDNSEVAGRHFDDAQPDILVVETDPEEQANNSLEIAEGGVAVVFLADGPHAEWVALALSRGARAILPRSVAAEELAAALRAVAAGLVVMHPDDLVLPERQRSPASPVEELTPREREVITRMGDGLSNKEIAARLGISEHTVKFHVASIMGKLGVSSRTEAVTAAIRQGLLLL